MSSVISGFFFTSFYLGQSFCPNRGSATFLTLDEFHDNEQQLLLSLHKNTICPPWLPPLGRLVKLASVKILILSDLKSSFETCMLLGVDFSFLIVLLILNRSAPVALFTLVLTSQKAKLISGLDVSVTKFS